MSDRRTGVHGLPAEYRTPAGEAEDWPAVLGYLQALERSKRPIVVATVDRRMSELNPGFDVRLTQQIGFLQRLETSGDRRVHRFGLHWPHPDQPCGEFIVDERLFEGAGLSTADADDYFGLTLDLGPISLTVLDANTNMDRAYAEWSRRQHRTYLSLPSAREIEEKWRAEPNHDVIREQRHEVAELRASLVDLGAPAAGEMSDAELAAAGERVSWRLRTSGRMGQVHHSEWKQLWFDELAADLRAGTNRRSDPTG